MDYAQARYYAGIQGRFTSVDPLQSSGRLAEPQSLNRYAYVLNNPLALTDPTGLIACPPNKKCTTDEKGNEWFEEDGIDILVGPEGKAKKDPPPDNSIGPAIALPLTVAVQGGLRLPPFLIATGIVGIGWGLGDSIANPRPAPYRHRDGGLSTTAGTQAYPVNLNLPQLFPPPTTLPDPTNVDLNVYAKTAEELISGSLKKSPSYHSELGGKTQAELEALAKKTGDEARKAGKMLKLIKEGARLRPKGNKK